MRRVSPSAHHGAEGKPDLQGNRGSTPPTFSEWLRLPATGFLGTRDCGTLERDVDVASLRGLLSRPLGERTTRMTLALVNARLAVEAHRVGPLASVAAVERWPGKRISCRSAH